MRPPARADTSLLPTLRRAAARPAHEPYTDQLVFAQALLLHRAGQEQRARQLLTPLTVGDSPAAAYHQYLLGLWQLKQEQYATAAGQLARAAGNGFGAAWPAQLLARFINSPPDSLAAFATVLRQLPDSNRRAVEKLRAQAAAGAGSRPGAWAARLTETARTKDADAVEGELRKAARLGAGPLGADLYGRALVARLRQRPAEEQRLYAQIIREAPFNEPAMLAAADFYTRRQDAAAAHETLRRGLEENPASPALLEAYVLAAARAGLFDYATAAIEQLRPQLSPAAYATLRRRLTQTRAAHDAAF